jgi:hypothetical protein
MLQTLLALSESTKENNGVGKLEINSGTSTQKGVIDVIQESHCKLLT